MESEKKDTGAVLRGTPVVCAVLDNYIICVPMKRRALVSVTVGGREYFCHSNGIRRSDAAVQKFTVPMSELDREKSYTVRYETLIARKAYRSRREAPVSLTYEFKPLNKRDNINIYHISDSHGLKTPAQKAGAYFGEELDLLIMNGDIASQSEKKDDILIVYDIASEITKGRIPCIISRGNHDLRGKYAEKLEDFLPTDNGRTYYTVKLGHIWFLLLDCGEDKVDSHIEYGGTVCCHEFREEQTAYLESLKRNAGSEYLSPEFDYRIVLSHVPFSMDNTDECKGERPFNIERELYSGWCSFIRENIRPDFMLSGHVHTSEIFRAGGEHDNKNLGVDAIIAGHPIWIEGKRPGYHGAAITLTKQGTVVRFTDEKKQVIKEETILKRQDIK